MSPEQQAQWDWREEGAFHPEQFEKESQRVAYEAQASAIVRESEARIEP